MNKISRIWRTRIHSHGKFFLAQNPVGHLLITNQNNSTYSSYMHLNVTAQAEAFSLIREKSMNTWYIFQILELSILELRWVDAKMWYCLRLMSLMYFKTALLYRIKCRMLYAFIITSSLASLKHFRGLNQSVLKSVKFCSSRFFSFCPFGHKLIWFVFLHVLQVLKQNKVNDGPSLLWNPFMEEFYGRRVVVFERPN